LITCQSHDEVIWYHREKRKLPAKVSYNSTALVIEYATADNVGFFTCMGSDHDHNRFYAKVLVKVRGKSSI